MKDKQELLNKIKTHFNTKLIIGAFALELIILTVLFCIAGRSSVEDEGSYALREILSNAGSASSSQYSEIYSGANGNSEMESFVSKYIAGNDALMSTLSPSLSGYINHEYNVKNYIQGIKGTQEESGSVQNNNNVSADKDSLDYKYYQFVLDKETYHSELIIDGEDSVPAGVLVDQFSGEMIISSAEDFKYGPLLIRNPYNVPSFNLKELLETPLAVPMYKDDSPSVLLYYTHTSESYCVTEDDKYKLKQNNSDNGTQNVTMCGSTIYNILTEKYGINVINETSKNDVDYNHAYDASEALLKKTLAAEPTIDLAIDIHRDADNANGKKLGPTVSHEGKDYAPIMFVMGSGCNVGNDNWASNVKLAMLIIEKMESKVPGITKGMTLRKDTYLSEYANKGLLIEIGFNGNYVTEAKNTAEVFAEALGEVYGHNGR